MEYVYKTQGTCSTNIELNVEDGVVKEVAFWGRCNRNPQRISTPGERHEGRRSDKET